MTINVSPTVPLSALTHHISLTDRTHKTLGLVLCDDKGNPRPVFNRNPVDRTSFHTSTGTMTYGDFDYPYTPVAQDNWTGGRGNLDFERDATRFLDSYRLRTGRANKAFLGPQEQYTRGYRSMDYNAPTSVVFHNLLYASGNTVAKRFIAGQSYTATQLWMLLARVGSPHDVTVAVLADTGASPGSTISSVTVPASRLADILSEWVVSVVSAALTSGTAYWVEITANALDDDNNYWKVAAQNVSGTTKTYNGSSWVAANFDLYFLLTDADSDKTVIPYGYKEQRYLVVCPTSGAPHIWMNGDRGAADSNSGVLTALIDATKNWTNNQWVGCICVLINGTGRTEDRPYRTIESNTATQLNFTSDPWTITQDTTTEYVIIGSDQWQEVGAGGYGGTHGLTAPVTDVLVSTTGVVYFCQGDTVAIRRHREYNNSGVWTSSDWQDEGAGPTKAVFLALCPQANKIWKANNYDANGDVSVDSATPADWGTHLSFSGTVKKIGDKYVRITGLQVYFDDNSVEALWVGKEDRPWIVPNSSNPYPLSLKEMETVRSPKNFKASLVHNVYMYFTVNDGLEQYYSGTLTDIGPNLDEGLPSGRQGNIVYLLGYPGKFFAAIDGGANGYSSILDRDGGGWHERYRAPKGQRIRTLWFQVIPGPSPERLWFYQGNNILWLPMPSETTNELTAGTYYYTHEGALELSRMHAGMMDTTKLVNLLKLMSDNLIDDTTWLEADYRVDKETDWTPFPKIFTETPMDAVSLEDEYGLAGKRICIRIRFYTTDRNETPVLLAFVLEVVSRITIKRMYSLPCRIMDNGKDLLGQPDEIENADEMFAILDEWTNDAAKSMLKMHSADPLFDNRLVFLQPTGERLQVADQTPEDFRQERMYVVTLVAQDA